VLGHPDPAGCSLIRPVVLLARCAGRWALVMHIVAARPPTLAADLLHKLLESRSRTSSFGRLVLDAAADGWPMVGEVVVAGAAPHLGVACVDLWRRRCDLVPI
jgi:hypothetical protein